MDFTKELGEQKMILARELGEQKMISSRLSVHQNNDHIRYFVSRCKVYIEDVLLCRFVNTSFLNWNSTNNEYERFANVKRILTALSNSSQQLARLEMTSEDILFIRDGADAGNVTAHQEDKQMIAAAVLAVTVESAKAKWCKLFKIRFGTNAEDECFTGDA
eukprot:CAMPEP_0170070448 /NCGR_PEP_ID=MMETSP0019_2-20121128/8737_1 /TAXON_ID=98059 /ORGANISM="Dinobryon sp., Strain UTEXLB2267" /LENGTH=160 /DNA_ID=CAMNT_0010278731 /DNA_START=270 /DNA_END=752 /DNA_ORIENTATION=+